MNAADFGGGGGGGAGCYFLGGAIHSIIYRITPSLSTMQCL